MTCSIIKDDTNIYSVTDYTIIHFLKNYVGIDENTHLLPRAIIQDLVTNMAEVIIDPWEPSVFDDNIWKCNDIDRAYYIKSLKDSLPYFAWLLANYGDQDIVKFVIHND